MKNPLLALSALLLTAASLNATVIFYDALNYAPGNITTNSSGNWLRHSGSGNDSLEVSGRYEVNQNRTDDIHRWFDPATTNGYLSGLLYASFTMKMTNLPSAAGSYFAHFMDSGTNAGGGGSEFRGRIFALTSGAAAGAYRLGIANAAVDGSPNQVVPMDLFLNVDYQVVVKYDIDNAEATLWVNPALESDPNSGGTGDSGTVLTPLAAFSFRQTTGEGVSEITKLLVGMTFADVATNAVTIPTIIQQPVAVSNFVGNAVSLTVQAVGQGVLSYQWVSNGVAIPGATSNVYTIASLAASDAGSYYCGVTNNLAAGTNSVTVQVAVNTTPTAPVFTVLPQNTTNAFGGTATFTATAVGTGPISYQWKYGTGSPINLSDGASTVPGSTATISGSGTATLTISNLTAADGTNYTVTASGSVSPATNAGALLVVLPPAILVSGGTTYSQNFDSLASSGTANAWSDGGTLRGWYASKTAGGSAVTTYRAGTGSDNNGALYSFGVAGVSNVSDRALGSVGSGTPGNFAYGFLFINDTAALVATNLTIAYTGEQWRNGGNSSTQSLTFSYRKSFSAITGSDAASNFVWTAVPALNFNSPTVGATLATLDGNNATNRTVISGVVLANITLLPGEEIFFRWFDLNDTGNDHGLALDDLSLTFTTFSPPHTPPVVSPQPQSVTNNATTTAILTAGVTGFLPMTFQWYKGATALVDGVTGSGSVITGSTNSPILTIANVFQADADDYHLSVSNSLGGTNSLIAHLTVIDPAITTQPVNVTNVLGDNGNFFAFANGTAPITYQWLSNGVPIPGATADRLDIPVTLASSAANYSVAVTNGNASGAISSVANIVLVPTPSTKIAEWDFNSSPPDANTNTGITTPSIGNGTFTLLPGNTSSFQPGTFADLAAEAASDDNSAVNTTTYPAAGTGNKTGGVQFSLSTEGYGRIVVTWEQRNSATASKYTRLQYTTDGSTWNDYTVQTMNVGASLPFEFFLSDLSGIPAVNNNPNFGIRIVSEFQSTATGSGLADYVPTLPGSYGPAGTMRYDWVNVFADPQIYSLRSGNSLTLSWTNAALTLQGAPAPGGAYTNIVPMPSSPYIIGTTNQQGFFRLKGN